MSTSAWQSVNDMLIQNRCWLCRAIFKKGKIKKVFTIAQVIQYFDSLPKDSDTAPVEFISDNFKACYEAYGLKEGQTDAILRELQSCDVAPWMSGLVCAQTKECALEFDLIAKTDIAASITKLRDDIPAMSKAENCPPGCDCDSPWSFLS